MTLGTTAAIVLAAGRSSRMGRPKTLLDLGGEPALGRVLRVLREVPVTRIVVVLRPVDAELRRRVDLTGLTTAVNVDPDARQTASLRIGLKNVPSDVEALLLCPVDVPLFEVDDVRMLLSAFRSRPPGVAIVVPSFERRRGHPVVVAKELAAEFAALRDDEPAHTVIRRDPERILHVETTNENLVRDLDTPEDLEAARRSISRPTPPPDR